MRAFLRVGEGEEAFLLPLDVHHEPIIDFDVGEPLLEEEPELLQAFE